MLHPVSRWKRPKLEALRETASPAVQEIVSKRFFGRTKKGAITQQHEFEPYILRALIEMGGSGKTKDVLDRVGELMKSMLKPLDYETHPSAGNPIRWRISAQWARNTMVNRDGRMAKSRSGIWTISEKGKEWLEGL